MRGGEWDPAIIEPRATQAIQVTSAVLVGYNRTRDEVCSV